MWIPTSCHTKRDNLVDAAVIQRVNSGIRYTPAQQDISSQNNTLMYTQMKLLWLKSPQGSRKSPEKSTILKAYERIQHRVLVDDPVLGKAGFPLPKINIKMVHDFICAQERLLNLRATNQPVMLSKNTSVSSADLPPAPHQPAVLPPPLRQYVPTPSTAGTKLLKGRRDMIMPLSHPQTSLPLVSLPRPVRPTPAPRPLPSPSPSTATRVIAGPSTRPILPASQSVPGIAGHYKRLILPATSTITRPVPSLFPGPILPASQPTPVIAGPSSMPLLPVIQATPSVAGLDVYVPPTMPEIPATLECSPSSWAKSTLYKRKVMDEPSGVGAKGSRVQKLPACTCCGQPTQGHKKYKRKVFCAVKRMSPSKGLENTVYNSFEHFTSVVDTLEQ
ncbi:Myosin-1 [Dissostichus eleginoides]|uniref:Myosin-1 n=1 Tax=Dissostichus eleginoides TaxID=100907 RepID=A0AAD9F0A1_DISEL|nr:Myosin-1 [Dissostichus eleginoides]